MVVVGATTPMPAPVSPYCGVWPKTLSESEVLVLMARSRSGRWSLAQALSSGKNFHPSDRLGKAASLRFSISCGRAPPTNAAVGPNTNSKPTASSHRVRRSLGGGGIVASCRALAS